MTFSSPEFWMALLQIIGINIVLSGDNAVVIALASRGLPPHQQKTAIAWGSGAAVVMRIVLTIVAVKLLQLPSLKLIGSVLLIWIAVQLLLPEDEDEDGGQGHSSLMAAIRTILIADLVMSLDNVIAVAAAARGNTVLLIVGLAISIPLVVFASQILLKLMERFPIIITIGAALLGWVAGEMAVSDPLVAHWIEEHAHWLHVVAPAAGAILVIALGRWLAQRKGMAAKGAHGPTAAAASVAATAGTGTGASAAASAGPFRRLLVAVDDSEHATQAVERALAIRQAAADPAQVQIDLVNVQRALPGTISAAGASHAAVEDYRHERSDAAFNRALARLRAAGVTSATHTAIGEPGQQIARVAGDLGSELIIMGARGLGNFTGRVVGSVTMSTIEHAGVPVMIVKA